MLVIGKQVGNILAIGKQVGNILVIGNKLTCGNNSNTNCSSAQGVRICRVLLPVLTGTQPNCKSTTPGKCSAVCRLTREQSLSFSTCSADQPVNKSMTGQSDCVGQFHRDSERSSSVKLVNIVMSEGSPQTSLPCKLKDLRCTRQLMLLPPKVKSHRSSSRQVRDAAKLPSTCSIADR